MLEEWEKKKKEGASREVSLPCQSQTGITIESSSKKRKSNFSPIAKSFNMNVRAQLDEEIARMFYTSGLPFNFARNPHYQRTFTFTATHNIAATWQEKRVTSVCDGWSDPTIKALINFMATSGNGPMFLKAVNCFGDVKDKFFIANLMKEVIDEVGHQNVVQIITDNASNCKGA
ncbi:hypothetical protein V6N11_010975 [Hibiscus sabdariffa]|uniref:DUF659 domain-containing protein n=1 Tax=Hibiscus sabdariffa TaxID=183260 RepID=A0ABR2S7D7_9ROSI